MIWHIIPINDLIEHDEKSTCNCEPIMEILEDGDLMIIHTALDGRK